MGIWSGGLGISSSAMMRGLCKDALPLPGAAAAAAAAAMGEPAGCCTSCRQARNGAALGRCAGPGSMVQGGL